MSRFFIELAYKGKHFAGFQKQPNAITVQGEIDQTLSTILRTTIETTTSSRTDAGVHALQNYLHFDYSADLPKTLVYNANSILNKDLVILSIRKVQANAHSRFDARSRTYEYVVYQNKNPFLKDFGYFFPFKLDVALLHQSADIFKANTNFQSFCKRHTEVNNYNCELSFVKWTQEKEYLKFTVRGNRFLRGMVRALVMTSLQIARGKIALDQLQEIIDANDCQRADFSAEARGLKLISVDYPEEIFID